MPAAPISRTQAGTTACALTAWVCTTLTTAASGPTALATSLEPWAKAMAQAVKIIRMPNTRSTLVKRLTESASLSLLMPRIMRMPSSATRTPITADTPMLWKKLG